MRPAVVALASLAIGASLFLFVTGPVRGALGDVVVITFLVGCLATARIGSARTRVGGVLVFAVGVELVQLLDLVAPDSHWLLHLTLGSTFDWLDLLWYAVGGALSWACERWFTR